MDENKALAVVKAGRRHVRREERERILARWVETGVSGEAMAKQTGLSRATLSRWKSVARTSGPTAATRPALVEVPAPSFSLWAAEAVTSCGVVRLSAHTSPAWAAQLLRELSGC